MRAPWTPSMLCAEQSLTRGDVKSEIGPELESEKENSTQDACLACG